MSSDLVARRLTFVDKIRGPLKFFAIDRDGDEWAAGWEFLVDYPELYDLVSKTTAEHLEQAFLRYVEPIAKDIRYTAKQTLERWPEELIECYLWGDCVMQSKVCWLPVKNKCEVYQPGKGQPEQIRIKLQDMYNLLREGHVIIVVDQAK